MLESVWDMGWFYATEEGEMYNSCVLYRQFHPISASWTSAFLRGRCYILSTGLVGRPGWHVGSAAWTKLRRIESVDYVAKCPTCIETVWCANACQPNVVS
jgi:hypothetical protein